MPKRSTGWSCVVLGSIFGLALDAQETLSTLRGTAMDPTGAVVPGTGALIARSKPRLVSFGAIAEARNHEHILLTFIRSLLQY